MNSLSFVRQLAYQGRQSLEGLTIGLLRSVLFQNRGANPAVTGELSRNGSHLYWFDGSTAVRLDLAASVVAITAATTLLSGTFAIDSTGVKTVTTAHGLSVTPAIQDVQVSVTEDSNVDDWAFDLLKVESVDGTNVVCKINVSTASATGSATAKLGILVITGV